MKNQSRAAAQTASIGNQDMMTFMPSPVADNGEPAGAAAGGDEMAGVAVAASSSPQTMAMMAPTPAASSMMVPTADGQREMGGMVPNPLGGSSSFDRGESMDDEAFNASLDALLKEASCDDPYGDMDSSAGNSLAGVSTGSNNSAGGVGGGRKRKKCGSPARGALVTEMSSLTNSSDSIVGQGQGEPATATANVALHHHHQQQPQQRQPHAQAQLNYSARGIVQLPPMFSSQPISVATTAIPGTAMLGNPNLMGTDLFSGGAQVPMNMGQQQQQQAQPQAPQAQALLPFQVASVAMPQQQHSQIHHSSLQQGGNGNSANNGGPMSSSTASLMSQIASGNMQPQQQQQPSNDLFSGFQFNAAAALGFPTQPPAMGAATSSTPQAQAQVAPGSVPQAALSSIVPLAAAAAKPVAVGSSFPKKSSSTASSSVTGKRKRARVGTVTGGSSTLAVPEDECERQKRRSERNLREQERSHRITERIADLRNVLSEAGVHFKPDKHSTLVSVVNYIKMLQGRSKSLDEEHKKLLDTISRADQLVKSNHEGTGNDVLGVPGVGSAGNVVGNLVTTTVQTHRIMENTSSNLSTSAHSNDEEFLVFVQGIDYKSIFASCGVALAIASVDGRFVDCNEEFLRITNYTRGELLGEDPRLPRNSLLPHPQAGSGSPRAGRAAGQQGHQVVTVSTSTSANSSALTTAAAVAAAKTPDHTSSSHSPKSHIHNHPPTEITMRKQHHLSLFNLLGGEDMETVYTAMSRMLRAPELSIASNCLSSSIGKDDSGGTSSSSSDSFVKSDLTRSTEESGSSGNEVSNNSSGVGGAPGGDAEEVGSNFSRYTVDHWTGRVKHTRRKNHMLQLNISLVRTADGRPKFFNCAIAEAE